jgi:nucleolin
MTVQTRLFIRNLSWSVTETHLYDLFSEVGDVVSVKIPTRQEDGKPRGFAFVEMQNSDLAQKAIHQLNGFVFQNRDLVVNFQDENRDKKRSPKLWTARKKFQTLC